jgi:hypothetical protein
LIFPYIVIVLEDFMGIKEKIIFSGQR